MTEYNYNEEGIQFQVMHEYNFLPCQALELAINYTHLFHAQRNRVEIISDFPDGNDAEVPVAPLSHHFSSLPPPPLSAAPLCDDLYCFRGSPVFIPGDFTDTTGEVETNPGWLTTTGTSSGTRRWDVTVT